MILVPVWLLENRHILLAIGDLQEIKSGAKRANLAPNGVMQLPRKEALYFLSHCSGM